MTNAQANGQIKVTFLHPRSSESFAAAIVSTMTGDKAITNLVAAKFLDAGKEGSYVLALERTGKTLPRSEPLVAAGVQDGDRIQITQTEMGAGR